MVEPKSIANREVCRKIVRHFSKLVTCLLAVISTHSAIAQSQQHLTGHVPSVAARSQATGRLSARKELSLTIGLPLRNPEGLTNLLADLYNPDSTNYRNFLTPEDFTARFGPTEADYQAVKDFAIANGLTITHIHPNRTLLTVHGAVTDIEKAFAVNLLTYAHPKEKRSFFAPDTEPSLPASMSVLHIGGLNDFVLPHPMNLKRSPLDAARPTTANTGSGLYGTFIGNDFRSAYVPGCPLTGTGQSVALVEFDGYYPSDITSYESQANLPNVTLTNVYLENFNGTPVDPDANVEVSLDIEMLISMAPGLSRIIVYEEPNGSTVPNDLLNKIATDNLAAQVSASWSFSIDGNTEQIFLQYAVEGISYFNASGDSGAYTAGDGGPDSPCDDPNITSVGGTTLTTTGPNGAWLSEKVWSWFPDYNDASSGGISTTYTLPSWQQGISMSGNQGSTSMRNIPDVALTADNIFVEANNGTPTPGIGGTSAAAPLWAGFMALVNQQAASAGKSRIGFANPALYNIGKSGQYTACFHDITTGNNTNYDSPNLFQAVSGYDLCTGWGTPVGTNLINLLAPVVNGPLIILANATLLAESCQPTNGALDPGETVTFNFAMQNIGSANTTNLVVTLVTNNGLFLPSGAQTYGALTAGGSSVTKAFTFTAGGVCGSNITATFHLQDGAVDLGTISTPMYLGKPFSGTNFSQNFDSSSSLPVGWTSTASGAESVWRVSSVNYTTYPYCIYAPDAGANGISDLVSPSIPIGATNAQLTFQNGYDTYATHCGCVLEIQLGTNAYTDILVAGGSFVVGGYNSSISITNTSSPLAGRPVWSGVAGSFQNTVINLPAAAAGQNIHLRWRLASDNYYSYPGWYIDTVAITESFYACCTDTADLAVTQTASTNTVVAGHNVTYTLTVTNVGPQTAIGVSLTNILPVNTTFVSASSNGIYTNGVVLWNINSLNSGSTNRFTVTVTTTVGGLITNTAFVAAVTPDPVSSNQTAAVVTTVYAAPNIVTQPSNQFALTGSNAVFQVTAAGTPSPAYQWYFNTTNLSGATNSTMTLTNVQPAKQGNYVVIVTNSAGAVTSSVAVLTVAAKPAITLQPSNQSVQAGTSALIYVTATGTPSPAYQWYFNGTNLSGATTNTLNFSPSQPRHAGSYLVVLTNMAGSVTSSIAALSVNVPAPSNSANLTGNNLKVSLSSLLGVNYTLQYKTSLTSSNWIAVSNAIPGTGNVIDLSDTNLAGTNRFYRVLGSW